MPDASNLIRFTLEGPGVIVATDNGNPADMRGFSSHERNAFSGWALAIVRFDPGADGTLRIVALSDGIEAGSVNIYRK